MKIYLDSCAIQRPLDTFSNIRARLEAEAVLGILDLCDAGKVELVSSEALEYEMEQNSLPVRQEHARAVLAKAITVATVDESVEKRAEEFTRRGLKPLDALHLALAETVGVDYFCTCDDRLLKATKQIQGLKVKSVSPIELTEEIQA